MLRVSRLTLQNALARASLPAYLALRPVLRWRGSLLARPTGPWVVGGHSGRLYADNAAAFHEHASQLGREVRFVVSEAALARQLEARGHQVLFRNALATRVALENAELLVYSHGITDLDDVLGRVLPLRGLKVHLNHSMNFIKDVKRAEGSSFLSRLLPRARGNSFDYLLAVSPRERDNFLRTFPDAQGRVVLGGGAHLDALMRARGQTPARTIVYLPTHRDTPAARARLEHQVQRLTCNPRLHAALERQDLHLQVVAHINRAAHGGGAELAPHPRVQHVPPAALLESVLASAVFISDYSGMLCDQLALGRPTIFFPFDKEEYLRERSLYVAYDELAWGPVVETGDALIALFEDGSYRDLEPYAARRAYWEQEFFPRFTPDYAADTLRTIEQLLGERS